jgi:nucleoside-diphosphate-sugar epimerase
MNFYGYSKAVSEIILQKYHDYVIFRLGNVVGEGSKGYINKMRTLKRVTIFQGCVRDFIHVDDVVSVMRSSIEIYRDVMKNQIYNLGSGVGISYAHIAFEMKKEREDIRFERMPQDLPRTVVLNVNKIRKLFPTTRTLSFR